MGDQVSVHKSCCPVVVDPREMYFENEQKKLVEKQTNSPYRHHRRKSSSITNHSPIPLFCSKPKKYTFYFAALTPKEQHSIKPKTDDKNQDCITLLQHGLLQFNFGKNGSGSSSVPSSPLPGSSLSNITSYLPTIKMNIAPSYLIEDKYSNKLDINTKAVMLESLYNNLTNIEWFYYGFMKKDTECVLIVTDPKYGLIHEIDSNFNVTKPLAKICKQDNVGIVEILRFSNKYILDSDTDTNYNTITNGAITSDDSYSANESAGDKLKRISECGYNLTWTATKEGELIFGSTGMEYNTSVIRYTRSKELFSEDWRNKYNLIRYGCGAIYPGWIWIECMLWSHIHDKWFILPRYLSINAPFHKDKYKNYGCNVMLTATENFKDIGITPLNLRKSKYNNEAYVRSLYKNNELLKDKDMNVNVNYNEAKKFGIETIKDLTSAQREEIIDVQKEISESLCYSHDGCKGFISAQFLDGTNDQLIMGIRTHEQKDGKIVSSICVFNIHGDVFVDDYIMDGDNGYNGLIIL